MQLYPFNWLSAVLSIHFVSDDRWNQMKTMPIHDAMGKCDNRRKCEQVRAQCMGFIQFENCQKFTRKHREDAMLMLTSYINVIVSVINSQFAHARKLIRKKCTVFNAAWHLVFSLHWRMTMLLRNSSADFSSRQHGFAFYTFTLLTKWIDDINVSSAHDTYEMA